ncbi:MAG TPA: glycosyltransferase, partial [archaeon]|nr:glycosyltransferase [archaeon]
AQTGYSDYKPKGIECKDFLSLDDFRAMMKKSSLVITHAGEGNIGLGKNIGKKMIIVPRKKEFSEHTNDHQLELAHVCEEKKLGLVAWNISELGKKIVEAENFVPAKIARGNISQLLEDFLGKEFK